VREVRGRAHGGVRAASAEGGGRWAKGQGRWAEGQGRWTKGHGRWAKDHGRWAKGDGRRGGSAPLPLAGGARGRERTSLSVQGARTRASEGGLPRSVVPGVRAASAEEEGDARWAVGGGRCAMRDARCAMRDAGGAGLGEVGGTAYAETMRWFSSDPSEPGFIAVGQRAVGVIAFGQIAYGVIAVGQMARGVIAVGQAAIGVFAAGQLALGLGWGVGMVGLGGRGKFGVLRLLPELRRPAPPADVPKTVPLEALLAGSLQEGYLPARIEEGVVVLPEAARAHVDTGPVLELARTAGAAGETDGVVGVLVGRRPQEDGGYRDGAVQVRLEAVTLTTWRPPRWRFISHNGDNTASYLEVGLRAVAWLMLAVCYGVLVCDSWM